MDANFKSVRDLFTTPAGVVYKVPEYQRGFEWDRKNFEDLWTDIQRIGGRIEEHFLGNIILFDIKGNNIMEIVDGQQRMVTISILFMAIRDREDIEDDRRIDDILNSYPENEKERRVRLYDDDNDEQFKRLWEEKTEKVDGQIGYAYNYFSRKVNSLETEEVLDVIDKIVNNINVVKTISYERSLAYMVFQSQNERGIEVSAETLIKARVFGEADQLENEAHTNRVKNTWKDMYGTFRSEFSRPRYQKQDKIRRPLAHIILNSDVTTPTQLERSDQLYRNFDKILQSNGDIVDFVEWFESQSQKYFKITSNTYNIKLNNLALETRRYLQYCNAASTHAEVLSLAILNNCSESDPVDEYFRLAAVLPMRMEMAGYRSQDRKEALHKAARRVRNGDNVREILTEIINDDGPTDGEIIETVKANKRTVSGAWRFRTVLQLTSIEEQRRGPVRVDLGNLEIEHIAPRRSFKDSRYSEWRRTLDEESFVGQEKRDIIGNITLLDTSDHAGIDETAFKNKRREYQNSDLRITEEITRYDEWSIQTIDDRTKRLAKELVDMWSV